MERRFNPWFVSTLILAIVFSLGWASWMIAQEPIPPTIDPSHPGQPEWCQNEDSRRYHANCKECEARCGPGQAEDARCKTHCRKGACKCHPCET